MTISKTDNDKYTYNIKYDICVYILLFLELYTYFFIIQKKRDIC